MTLRMAEEESILRIPTHKALGIPEILYNVYAKLTEEDKRGTLVSMAQVCHAFTEPALDMVWRNMVGLGPFLMVLQSSSVVDARDPGMLVLAQHGWRRFEEYAYRVREFTQINDDFDHNFLRLLIRSYICCVSRLIFPNLHTLRALYIDKQTPPRLLESIITPSLRFLQVFRDEEFRNWEYEADIASRVIGILSGHDNAEDNQGAPVRHLVLQTFVPSTHLDQLISLRQLRTLRLMGITPEYIGGINYLQRLSTLPHLQDLLLILQENEFFQPLPHDGFPSLEQIVIQGSAPSVQYLLSALPPSRLKYIRIVDGVYNWALTVFGPGEVRARMEGWNVCFSALASQAETLTCLHITLLSDSATPGDVKECAPDLPILSVIEPLLDLRALLKVQLEGFIKMPFSDSALGRIVAAWRQIRHMVLPPPLAEVQQPCMTSLKLLALFCPNLSFLAMGLDAKPPASDDPRSEDLKNLHALPLAVTHLLYELDLCESVLMHEDVPWLVTQLRDWFPALKRVTASHSQEAAMMITTALLQDDRISPRTSATRRLSLSYPRPAKTSRQRLYSI